MWPANGWPQQAKEPPVTIMLPDQDLKYWLALHRAKGIGPAAFNTLLAHFNQPADIFDCSDAQLQAAGLSRPVIDAIHNPDWTGVENDLNWLHEDEAHHILTLNDPDYPALLHEISGPPPLLFVNGQRQCLNNSQIAMIGSRNPTPSGKQTATDFARHLAAAGLTISSGLAIGIDAACHLGALDASGCTIAVTGTGLDRIYPARNQKLAHQIRETGALISEFPVGTPARPENFPRRNRIISALSLGTLVIEAALRSGSLITARYALEQGREVFAIPGSIHNPLARGCHHLIKEGAKLVETADDIISELLPLVENRVDNNLRPNPRDDAQSDEGAADSGTTLKQEYGNLMENMGFDPVSVDEIINRSGLTAEEVSSMMLILELQGHVASSPGGCYIRVK